MSRLRYLSSRSLRCSSLLLSLLLVACTQQQQPVEPILTGTLPVSAPQTAPVGQPLTVTIGPVAGSDGATATLVAVGSYGTQLYRAPFREGVASIEVAQEQTRRAGVLTLAARSGTARGAASLQLVPGSAIEPLTPLVGPRSIAADGRQASMVVVVPFDTFGNPVAEGTPIKVRTQRPDELITEQEVNTSQLLAWTRIPSGTRAGRTTISVTTEQVSGPEATLLQVAGFPAAFTLSAEPDSLPADGRELVTLRTSVLADRFGNVLPDGTLVTFLAEGADNERRFLPAYTINGVAEAPLQAPTEPSILTVRATVYDIESAPLRVAFTPGPAVGTFPLTARTEAANGAVVLEAGPILGPLQQFVPDGTPVLFAVTDSAQQQQWLQAVAEAGRATIELRLAQLQPGSYTAEALAGSGRGTTTFSVPAR